MKKLAFPLFVSVFLISCASTGGLIQPIEYNDAQDAYLFFLRLDEADAKNTWSVQIDGSEVATVGTNNYFLYPVKSGKLRVSVSGKTFSGLSLDVNIGSRQAVCVRSCIENGKAKLYSCDIEFLYILSNVIDNLDKKHIQVSKNILEQEISRLKTVARESPRSVDFVSAKLDFYNEYKERIVVNIESMKESLNDNKAQQRDNNYKASVETNSYAKAGYSLAATANSTAIMILTSRIPKYQAELAAANSVVRRFQSELAAAERSERESRIAAVQNKPVAEKGSLSLDFDLKKGTSSYSANTIAIVIGNRDYLNTIPSVDYALNDALAVKEFCLKSMGMKEEDIFYKENATLSDIISIFGAARVEGASFEKSRIFRTASIMEKAPNVFIYFSGHGAPSVSGETKGAGYLVPVDADISMIQNTGYPIDAINRELKEMHKKGIVGNTWVVFDTCFSGRNGTGGQLMKNVSGLSVVPKVPNGVVDDDIIMYASAGDEFASWYPEKKHGLFTYFFLKGLSGDADIDCDSRIGMREFERYISGIVRKYANALNSQEQTPQIFTQYDAAIIEY